MMVFINNELSKEIGNFVQTFTEDNLHYIAKEKGSFVDQSKTFYGNAVFVLKFILSEIMDLSKFSFKMSHILKKIPTKIPNI